MHIQNAILANAGGKAQHQLPIICHILLRLREGLSRRPGGKGRIVAGRNHNGQVLGTIRGIFRAAPSEPPGSMMFPRRFICVQITRARREEQGQKGRIREFPG